MTTIDTHIDIVTSISTDLICSHKVCASECAGTMILEYYLTPTVSSTINLYSGIIVITYNITVTKVCVTIYQ